MSSGNKTVYIAVLGVLGTLAAVDAGHHDEDGFYSNWMVAEVDCRVETAADELPLTPPAPFAIAASAQVSLAWTDYRDCESH